MQKIIVGVISDIEYISTIRLCDAYASVVAEMGLIGWELFGVEKYDNRYNIFSFVRPTSSLTLTPTNKVGVV